MSTWKGGRKAAERRYREKNRDKRNAQKRDYYAKNKESHRERNAKYVEENREKVYAYNAAWQRRKRVEYRRAVVTGYGHKCICCGVDEILFLEIHHPNGDGKEDRKKHGGGFTMAFYKWLIENDFPAGYDLLCANCHRAIHRSEDGICPHTKNL